MILELHLLQSFPVSNLNRDDLGQPKSVTFGGVPRGRISSQALKRSARDLFPQHGLDAKNLGHRTKRLLEATCQELERRGHDVTGTDEVVIAGLHALGFKVEKNQLTQYLLFVSNDAVTVLADFCEQQWENLAKPIEVADKQQPKKNTAGTETDKKKSRPTGETAATAKRLLDATRTADIALFGRMIADNTSFNVDAASQVAHALSTHAVTTEFDFYTAVDDLKTDAEDSGADMMGTIDFNAACYYRYANLDLNQLTKNLNGDIELAAQAARAWLGAFVNATPTGKQTTTAARTMPETLLGTVRDHGAWNLANAFLRPVTGQDLLATSTERMLSHFQNLRSFYGEDQLRTIAGASVTADTAPLPEEDTVDSVQAFTDRLLTTALG